jgi:hypothetical protein
MKQVWTDCVCALMLISTAVAQSPSQPSAPTQASSGPNETMTSLKVPVDTSFFAKLITPMAISQAKGDDILEAQLRRTSSKAMKFVEEGLDPGRPHHTRCSRQQLMSRNTIL